MSPMACSRSAATVHVKQSNQFQELLTAWCSHPTLASMEVRFTPATEAKLNQLATQRGRNPEFLVQEAVERLIDYDEWFIREVEKGLAQIETGELLEHEEVGRQLEKLIAEKQRSV
jgi:predicted transcriptional regulator